MRRQAWESKVALQCHMIYWWRLGNETYATTNLTHFSGGMLYTAVVNLTDFLLGQNLTSFRDPVLFNSPVQYNGACLVPGTAGLIVKFLNPPYQQEVFIWLFFKTQTHNGGCGHNLSLLLALTFTAHGRRVHSLAVVYKELPHLNSLPLQPLSTSTHFTRRLTRPLLVLGHTL